jgi:hypothetical protein
MAFPEGGSFGFMLITLIINRFTEFRIFLIHRREFFFLNCRYGKAAHVHFTGDYIGNEPGAVFAD